MIDGLLHVAMLVSDYDEALAFFTGVLGFVVTEDTAMPDGKRWVTVAPRAGGQPSLVLSRAVTPEQRACVGKQAGGRVLLFVTTRDLDAAHRTLTSRGVRFTEAPRDAPYGRVAVFLDLYGNRWDLIEPERPR